MQVQIHTDRNIEGGEALTRQVETAIETTLGRFGERITRVEVHLSDENSVKDKGDDKKCVLEARLKGAAPVAVTHVAGSPRRAVDGAADKMRRLLDSDQGRLRNPKGRTSYGGDQTV